MSTLKTRTITSKPINCFVERRDLEKVILHRVDALHERRPGLLLFLTLGCAATHSQTHQKTRPKRIGPLWKNKQMPPFRQLLGAQTLTSAKRWRSAQCEIGT